MKTLTKIFIPLSLAMFVLQTTSAQYYNECAGQNVIYDKSKVQAPKPTVATGSSSGVSRLRAKDIENTNSTKDPVVYEGYAEDVLYDAKVVETVDLSTTNEAVRKVEVVDEKTGKVETKTVTLAKVQTDAFGNAAGTQYDLAVDGAFKGHTVAVLHLYTGKRYGEQFDFVDPTKALEEKGFSVFRWLDNPPAPEELRDKLKMACQLWIISDETQKLNENHLEVIKDFFDSGRGVYIWGDNAPFYADANYVGEALLGTSMSGNYMGNTVVGLKDKKNTAGIAQNHLITTGMNYVFEGITIANIEQEKDMTPLIWSSDGNVVTSVYEKDGKRAIFDGGFTRLYIKWDTAGTGRYVKNAAAWLANPEKFGDAWDKEKKGK